MSETARVPTPFVPGDRRDDPRVWVVFSGTSDLRILSFFKKGFRHCFVLYRVPEGWIIVDPLAHRTEVTFVPAAHVASLPQFFEQQGCRVVALAEGIFAPAPRMLPPMLFTCVEAVKRMIGLRRIAVVTPWQLYRALVKTRSPLSMKGK